MEEKRRGKKKIMVHLWKLGKLGQRSFSIPSVK